MSNLTRGSHDNGDKNTLLQRILFTGEATQSIRNIEKPLRPELRRGSSVLPQAS